MNTNTVGSQHACKQICIKELLTFKRTQLSKFVACIYTFSMLNGTPLLLFCSLFTLGSTWNYPSPCSVKQPSCSFGSINKELRKIQETLELQADWTVCGKQHTLRLYMHWYASTLSLIKMYMAYDSIHSYMHVCRLLFPCQ